MNNFEFATATRIVFGPGTLGQVAPAARQMGSRVLVLDGRSPGTSASLLADLARQGLEVVSYRVRSEPAAGMLQAAAALGGEHKVDVVIGFGGGSAIDAAKAVAVLLANGGEPLDYLEVVGRGKSLIAPSVPCIAVPTTAGTGAEVTRNAVVLSETHGIKASMRSPTMYPRLAVVDPELTVSLPPAMTASSGLDALAQLIEPFVTHKANPLVDAICREGLHRVARSLRRAFENGTDREAREDMALASLFSGLALANAGLGAVHGFAGPIGGAFPAPHGAVCARLLPPVIAANVAALRARAPESPALARYDEIARILTGRSHSVAADAVAWVADLCAALAVAPLSAYGITAAHLPALVERSSAASSMKANPVKLTSDEMRDILQQAL